MGAITSMSAEDLRANAWNQQQLIGRLYKQLERWLCVATHLRPEAVPQQVIEELAASRQATARLLGLAKPQRGLVTYSQG